MFYGYAAIVIFLFTHRKGNNMIKKILTIAFVIGSCLASVACTAHTVYH